MTASTASSHTTHGHIRTRRTLSRDVLPNLPRGLRRARPHFLPGLEVAWGVPGFGIPQICSGIPALLLARGDFGHFTYWGLFFFFLA